MKTIYDAPTQEMKDVFALALTYHPKVADAELAIALQSACKIDADDEIFPALKCRGMPAAAVIQKVSAAKRVLLDYDAIISIDLARWKEMTRAQQIAVLDHELEHIDFILKEDTFVYDDRQRPKFKLKPDEIVLTGFSAVIRRHGENALEYRSITAAQTAMEAAISIYAAARRTADAVDAAA